MSVTAMNMVMRAPSMRLDFTLVAAVALIAGGIWLAFGAEGLSVAGAILVAAGVMIALRGAAGWFGFVLPYLALPDLTGAVHGQAGAVATPIWLALLACWLSGIVSVSRLSALRRLSRPLVRLRDALVAALFGVWLLLLWEAITVGLAVAFIVLPPPSAIWAKLITSVPTLAIDFRQTFLKSALAGYAIGCSAGFAVALLADRIAFLKRGLLPVGNLFSALPIIGIAPIMVMWFGFDWQSKAAVVVAMTFFPMLVNTLAGLSATDAMDRDLMHTYAARYRQSLLKLRLPAALPFIFNALKINSTLAMIGAIVAEFFGTPVMGMGFRISTEVGRMNTDMVWAEIAVAALAGSAFYGAVALIERVATFWHPSFRQT
jgi:NitT/TauT family transport system permease protein